MGCSAKDLAGLLALNKPLQFIDLRSQRAGVPIGKRCRRLGGFRENAELCNRIDSNELAHVVRKPLGQI